MSEQNHNQPLEVDRRIAEAAHDLARRRITEISRDAEKEKGIETLISAIENGGDDFSAEDVENYRLGRKDLIKAPKAMYIEGYLKEIEGVSKDLTNTLQTKCAEIIKKFPYRLR